MNDHYIFSLIYISVTWIFTFVQSEKIRRMSDRFFFNRNNYSRTVVFFMFFLILFIAFRPALVGGDTGAYIAKYVRMMNGSFNPEEYVKDIFFQRFQFLCAQIMPVSFFFLIVAFLYVFLIYVACKRFVRNNFTYLTLFAFGAFSFFSYGVNGIRNGMAASFIVLALSYISGNLKDKLLCVLLCLIAISFHGSTLLPIVAMLFSYFIKRSKFMFYIWGGAVLGSIVIGQSLSSILMIFGVDERLMHYMTLEDSEETDAAISGARFRWDFLIYSFMPILLGWYCVCKKRIRDLNYHLLLGTYIYSNAVWVILIRLPFSNRFAYLSWFLYAIVLAYPLFKFHLWNCQGRKVAMIMMAHVSFTFLMWFYSGL